MSFSVVSNIKRIAKGKNLTIKQIGRESGVGENSIYRWDRQTPNVSSLKKVSEYLDIPLEYLLNNEEED